MIICLFVWHSLATLPHTQQQRQQQQLQLVENCSMGPTGPSPTFLVLPASFSLLFMMKMSIWRPVACVGMCLFFQLPAWSICWPSTGTPSVHSQCQWHRRVFHFQASRGLGKVDVGKKSGIYLDYPQRLMSTHLIGSHSKSNNRKGNSTLVFYTVKFPNSLGHLMLLNSPRQLHFRNANRPKRND